MRRDLIWLGVLLSVVAIGFWLVRSRQPAQHPVDRSPGMEDVVITEGLPDLVVTEVYWDAPYIRVNYRNDGGWETPQEKDFLVKIRSGEREFGGNSHYRFPLPGDSREVSTGGYTIGLVGLEEGMEAEVTATIDWEGRVRESNEANNQLTRRIRLSGPTLVNRPPSAKR